MSSAFIKGTITITIATFISKVLGSVFQIPLQNIAGDEVVGIFRLVYPVYMIALILSVAGIPLAISKLISEARAKNNRNEIRDIFKTASILGLIFGLLSFTVMVVFSKPIARSLGGEFTELAVVIVSATLIFAPYMAVYRGFFQGFEDMKPTALSQVIEQFIRVVVTLVIAYLLVKQQQSPQSVAGWIMIGSIAGVLSSLLYLCWTYKRSIYKPTTNKGSSPLKWVDFKATATRILTLSLPIAVGALTLALFQVVDSVTVPHALNSRGLETKDIQEQFGIYGGRGLSLVQIAVVFSSALILPLIPLISKTTAKNDWKKTNAYIARSLKLAHLVSWPAAIGLFVLAMPINIVLFTNAKGTDVIAILGLSALFTSFTVLTTGILQGLGRSTNVAWLLVGATIVKGATNIWFVQTMGTVGAAWSTLFIYFVVTVIHLIWIHKITAYEKDWKSPVKIAFASFVMGLFIAAPQFFFNFNDWTRINGLIYLVIVIGLGAMIYAVVVLLTNVISKEERQSIPIVGRVFDRLSS
jgi:O-antigen/teichoic acid export membrane protein